MPKSSNANAIRSVVVYLERRKSKELVGFLQQRTHEGKQQYEFIYDDHYLQRKNAIPLGPEFPLTKKNFSSKKLFPTFEDRIPSKENPAYPEYCRAAGISPAEGNPFILLTTIGRKGPSSFVFEPSFPKEENALEISRFRQNLGLTIREFATAFDISPATVQKLEREKNSGSEAAKRLSIYLKFPKVALHEIQKNKAALHGNVFQKIIEKLQNEET